MEEWCSRIAQAKAAGMIIPEAQLFRRMLWHDFFWAGSRSSTVFCNVQLLPEGEVPEPISGLALAGTVDAQELHVAYAAGTAPLSLSADEVEHFRSFVPITVVENLLLRLQDGEDLQVEEPFARLRDFDGFLTVCAGGQGQPAGEGETTAASPLKMALAPDVEGRKLAAAFTSEDALQLFVVSKENARGSDGALLLECVILRDLC